MTYDKDQFHSHVNLCNGPFQTKETIIILVEINEKKHMVDVRGS